jgi:hypothetical protein
MGSRALGLDCEGSSSGISFNLSMGLNVDVFTIGVDVFRCQYV